MYTLSLVVYISPENTINPYRALKTAFENFNLEPFKGKTVAIKLHMGERGNRTHLHPSYATALVKILTEFNCKPFLTDTTTLYIGSRLTGLGYLKAAAENGFSPSNVGAPVIIADGLYGEDTIKISSGKLKTKNASVGRALYEAEAIIVLSHVKGHALTGFAGAIKNVAMGFASKNFKLFMHRVIRPVIAYPEKCTGCGICAKNCPGQAITLVSGKPKIDFEKCIGCKVCASRCPNGVITVSDRLIEKFNVRLGECAAIILKALNKKPILYVNVAEKVTRYCDCVSEPPKIVAEDSGIYVSEDPVAVDTASFRDVEKHLTQAKTLKEINNVNPWTHVKAVEKAKIGKTSYTLKTLTVN